MTKLKQLGLQDRPLNTINFECPSHNSLLLIGLDQLRKKEQLLDIILIAEGEHFKAHRAVLASCSDYFRAMFTDAMVESRQNEIILNGVTAKGIKLLFDYAYTGRLALNLDNVQDVLSAASHVQMVAVVEACSNYLQSQLDIENCIDIATIAETYSLTQLRQGVYRFISGNLIEFSNTNEFYRMSPQQLEYLLECDFPVDCSEADVLRIVLMWFNYPDSHSQNNNISYLIPILKKIHFSEISNWKIGEIFQKNYIQKKNFLYKLILDVKKSIALPSEILMSDEISLVNSRGLSLGVIKVGGFGIGGITNELTYCLLDSPEPKWRHLTSIPHVEQCNFGTAVLNNELYVVGGCFNQSLQENIHPFGFRYSPRYNKWSTMAPMQKERCRFSLNEMNGLLYAIGGAHENFDLDRSLNLDDMDNFENFQNFDESLCEVYDPGTDSWKSIKNLPEYRSQHAGACLKIGEKYYLFVSGGLDRDLVLNTLTSYDPQNDFWETRANLLTPRADHVMLAINGKLYICGGWRDDIETGNRVLINTIDVWDPVLDQWKVVTTVPTPRYHAGIVCVDKKIIFIGGFHSDFDFDKDTAAIESYDIDSDKWMTGDKYPQDVWEHSCVTMYIPRCREDMEVMKS